MSTKHAEFTVERITVESGRSFSAGALDSLGVEMLRFVTASVMERWDETEEPPTTLTVKLTVDVA